MGGSGVTRVVVRGHESSRDLNLAFSCRVHVSATGRVPTWRRAPFVEDRRSRSFGRTKDMIEEALKVFIIDVFFI